MEVRFSFLCLRSSPGQTLVQPNNVRLSRTKSDGLRQCLAWHLYLYVPSKQFEVFRADACQESSQQAGISR
jgi:hypothetical protein